MRPLLKFAWVNLIIAAILVMASVIQFFVNGIVSMSPAVIALFVIGPLIVRLSKDKISWDERDGEIDRQAATAGLWTVFIYFTAVGVYVMLDFDKNPVEHQMFINYFCVGYLLFFTAASLATIVLFGWSREKPGGIFEILREMTPRHKEAAIVLPFVLSMLIIALLRFPVSGHTPGDIALGIALMLIPLVSFFLFPFLMIVPRQDEFYQAVSNRARRVRLWSGAITGIAGLMIIAALYLFKGPEAIHANLFAVTGFCAFSMGILGFLVCLLPGSATPAENSR
ncbi:MAG: DUF2178 domain-containing protein [Candidatus Glassbacteria bacterium]|nr:DUF2178 domain-containing protein [Candidatus Glassbacteria bacterium]